MEFVKVEGPTRTHELSFSSSYQQVAQVFEDQGYNFQWETTTASMPPDDIPPTMPSGYSSYYRDVLDQAQHETNPYVTTVVLNPHHDQRSVAHVGAAPIRSMLATVDYGAHSTVTFSYYSCGAYSCQTEYFPFSPFLESLIYSDRQDRLQERGWEGGGISGPRLRLVVGPSRVPTRIARCWSPSRRGCRNPDTDNDGVLDGEERNPACIERSDCDGDGLDDGKERG